MLLGRIIAVTFTSSRLMLRFAIIRDKNEHKIKCLNQLMSGHTQVMMYYSYYRNRLIFYILINFPFHLK